MADSTEETQEWSGGRGSTVCEDELAETMDRLLNRASNLRKDIIRVRSNQPDRAHDNDENDGQHDGVFRDVLALFIIPELL
jgi:hypothetical protein